MPEGPAAVLQSIRQKLSHLRARDPKYQLFGALSHEYRLGAPLTEADLRSFERQFGVSLPSDYRLFLTQIGHGGAGPYYGLFALDDQDPENITDINQLAEPFPWKDAFNSEGSDDATVDHGDDEFLEMSLPGALYLCHYGCALRFFLVVAGPSSGEVWHDFRADGRGIYPAAAPDGRHPGFLEWYGQWVDQSLAEF
jgi:hypothetical protein